MVVRHRATEIGLGFALLGSVGSCTGSYSNPQDSGSLSQDPSATSTRMSTSSGTAGAQFCRSNEDCVRFGLVGHVCNTLNGFRCVPPQMCGNGVLEASNPRPGQPSEACDDGNLRNGDGCSEYCQIEQLAVGQPCTEKPQCLEGSCVEGFCRAITNAVVKTPSSVRLERDSRFPSSLARSGPYAFFGGFSEPLCDDPTNASCGFKSTIQVFREEESGGRQAWVHHRQIDLEPEQSWMLGATLKAGADTLAISGRPWDGDYYGVHLYQRQGEQWVKASRLQVPDSTPRALGEDFGSIIDMDEKRLVVGVPWGPCLVATFDQGACTLDPMKQKGRVFVFERGQDDWKLTNTLYAPGVEVSNGFGRSVSLRGDRLVVGESMHAFCERFPRAKNLSICQGSGSVHIFDFDGGAWQHKTTLEPPVAQQDPSFGSSVSHDGSSLVVGAPAEQECCATQHRSGDVSERRATVPYTRAGAAHVYVETSTGWTHHRRFVSSFLRSDAEFGRAVGLRGKRIVVGSSNQAGLCRLGSNSVNAFDQLFSPPGYRCQGSPLETFYFEGGAWGRETILVSSIRGGSKLGFAGSFEITQRSVLALDEACEQAGGVSSSDSDVCSGGAVGAFFEFSYD